MAITGGTCSGKTVLSSRLKSLGFVAPVSTTSRPPRPGEQNAVDYLFVESAEFENLVACGEMLEHSIHSGHGYGISWAEMSRAVASGAPVVSVVDPSGAESLRNFAEVNGHVFCGVFLDVPARLQRTRLFDRFARAVLGGKDPVCLSEEYAERLTAMEVVEAGWASAALSGEGPYTVVFPCFDEAHERGVIAAVVERCGLAGHCRVA